MQSAVGSRAGYVMLQQNGFTLFGFYDRSVHIAFGIIGFGKFGIFPEFFPGIGGHAKLVARNRNKVIHFIAPVYTQ